MFPAKQHSGYSALSLIEPNGDVLLIPDDSFDAICGDVNLADFWGEQECTMKYGSWTYNMEKLDLGLYADQDAFDMAEYMKSSPLKVIK